MPFAELSITSNFTFLKGASHPEEYARRAAELGLTAFAIADRNSVAGVVRAHQAIKELRRVGEAAIRESDNVDYYDVIAHAKALKQNRDPHDDSPRLRAEKAAVMGARAANGPPVGTLDPASIDGPTRPEKPPPVARPLDHRPHQIRAIGVQHTRSGAPRGRRRLCALCHGGLRI